MKRQVVYAAIAVLTALWAGAYVLLAQTPTAAELRSQLTERYEIVALQQGIALVRACRCPLPHHPGRGWSRNSRCETLTAAQLRAMLGADANW